MNAQNIARLATLVQSSPDLGFYVRELTVIAQDRAQQPGSLRPCISWIETHLSKLGECLSHICKLEIAQSKALRDVAFRGKFDTVTTLVLRHCTVVSNDRFIQLLNCFPSLQSLLCSSLDDIPYPKSEVTPRNTSFKSLIDLKFIGCTLRLPPIVDWLSSQSAYLAIETFTIGPIDRAAFESMQMFITTIAKTIKHLAISFLDMLDEDALGNCILSNAQEDKGSELTIIE